ncbi:peptidase S8/S53 domain-containing protein [Mucidula mucida]|nr:peptidase S8/S53 domain-containing protein [Mucidula mucida]
MLKEASDLGERAKGSMSFSYPAAIITITLCRVDNVAVLRRSTALGTCRPLCDLLCHELKESFNAPAGWHSLGLPLPEHNIELQIGLHQPNFHVLEQHLYEVSDPDHVRYGQHLTKAQVDELVAPHDEALALVNEWLASYGVDDSSIVRSAARDWIRVTLPVKMVEEMLDTTYQVWKHVDGTHLVRTTSYSLPDYLHPHIDSCNLRRSLGDGRNRTAMSSLKRSRPWLKDYASKSPERDCRPCLQTSITIDCLLQLYNATGFTPSAPGNSIGITGYLEQYANEADLQSFYADQVPKAINSSFEVISVKGVRVWAYASHSGDILFDGWKAAHYSGAGDTSENSNEPYNDWIDFVLAQEDPPKVISTSYGESEQSVPFSYAERACRGFAQLGACAGITVTFSSGDGGVGNGDSETQCLSIDGKNTPQFLPLFPAGCPFVTAIGGTVNVPEIAVDFSGGGFSNYVSSLPNRDTVVPAYINALAEGTYAGLFNISGRGIPDIAAEGRRFRVWFQGGVISVGGTSASSPTAAGIIALLNDVRISKGQPTLGFLNPLIYKDRISAAFKDITIGNNPGCGTEGFNATEGWDPVTGFGTPNFGLLKDLI